jgi:hypothetical protein
MHIMAPAPGVSTSALFPSAPGPAKATSLGSAAAANSDKGGPPDTHSGLSDSKESVRPYQLLEGISARGWRAGTRRWTPW